MPREVVLLGTRPLSLERVRAVLEPVIPRLELLPVELGGALVVLSGGSAVLTLVRQRPIASATEAARLLPGERIPAGEPLLWMEAVVATGATDGHVTAALAAVQAAVLPPD